MNIQAVDIYIYTFCLKKAAWLCDSWSHTHYTKAYEHKQSLNPTNAPEFQHTLSMVTQFLTAQLKAGPQMKPAPFTLTHQSKKSVSRAPRYSTSLLTPLSPPTQLLAATLSPHHCQCHCHHHAQHAPTLLLTFPLTKPGPWGFSCRLFWDTIVELSGESKPCSPAAGDPLDSGLLYPVRQPTATRLHSPDPCF